MDNVRIIKAHNCSWKNREQLSKVKRCGCFYCLKIFEPKEIDEWVDDNQTALCPYCGIDSVIYDNKVYPVTKELLEEMKSFWFDNKL